MAAQQQLAVDPGEAERARRAKARDERLERLELQVRHLMSVLPGVLTDLESLRGRAVGPGSDNEKETSK